MCISLPMEYPVAPMGPMLTTWVVFLITHLLKILFVIFVWMQYAFATSGRLRRQRTYVLGKDNYAL